MFKRNYKKRFYKLSEVFTISCGSKKRVNLLFIGKQKTKVSDT